MGGQAVALARQAYGSSVQMIVVSPVFKLLSDATTDDHFQLIRVNSHSAKCSYKMIPGSSADTFQEYSFA